MTSAPYGTVVLAPGGHDLQQALDEAHRARQALSRMEHQWSLVKEQGGTMPEAFWAAFGKAHAAVSLAERAVCKAREPK